MNTGGLHYVYPFRPEFRSVGSYGEVVEQDQSIDAPDHVAAGSFVQVESLSKPTFVYGIPSHILRYPA